MLLDPQNGPSGPRRECGVNSERSGELRRGNSLAPSMCSLRRVEAALGRRNPKRKTRFTACLSFILRKPFRCRTRPGPRTAGRRFCAVQAFCRRQNLGAGAIHLPRACEISQDSKKKHQPIGWCFFLEVTPGFEPGNEGFADPCLTTWLCHRFQSAETIPTLYCMLPI